MKPQYTYDNNGNPIGVFLPIEDWNRITEKYNDIEELPDWQKKLIDERLEYVNDNPNENIELASFLNEMKL